MRVGVRQLRGVAAVEAALAAGEPVTLVLVPVPTEDPTPDALALAAKARARGIAVREVGRSALERYAQDAPGTEALGLAGERPEPDLDAILAAGGAAWLLCGIRYPGNAGFAMRAAEVSGACGVIVDADFDHVARRESVRASMRADWFMPVCWADSPAVLDAAGRTGHTVVGIEDSGSCGPWDVDLRGDVLFVVGGERHGTPPEVLDRCDHVVRVPMAGFIPSYNLQAAVAVLAAERLRQLGVR